MPEFVEIIKEVPNMQIEISQTIDKYYKESFSTRSQLVQTALIQSKVFKQATNLMGDTISHMDIKLEQIDNKIQFLEDKIGIPDVKIVEEKKSLDLNKISSKEKGDKFMNRLDKTPNKHEKIKN